MPRIPSQRALSPRRLLTSLVLAMFLASLVAAAVPATGRAPAAAAEAETRGPAMVSADLRQGLTASVRGRVPAVVTAHSRSELATIERLGIRGIKLNVLPMILVDDLTEARLDALQGSSAVRSVFPNREYRVDMEDSTWITGARYVWGPSAATRFDGGYDGEGVDIAVIDTGIDGKHEDTDNLVEFCDTTLAVTGTSDLVTCFGGNDPSDSAAARLGAFDDEGHGSHVSGTVAGSGDASGGMAATHSTIGMAPQAQLHVYSANVGPTLLNFQILAAYDDMIKKKMAGSGVVATSNSFGGGDGANYSPDDPQNVAIKAAYDVGIISVYAAGNSGPDHNTLSDSCINPYVVCVGATTKPDSVVQFSSRGRPSEPADTNRNGIVGDDGSNGTMTTADDIPADVAPDNHDRKLGQQLGIGLYRPTLVAPGVNIDSISANAPACKEAADPDTGCYEPLNGTSMATPHVSGGIGIIVQAWRETHSGATPSAAKIIDILERTSGLHKLPGYEAEEQGAGRLNMFDAVRFIRGEIAIPRPNLGTPSPVYAPNKFPGAPGTMNSFDGCTGALSFTVGNSNPLDEPADSPPDANTGRHKQHLIDVPAGAERLRITVRWPEHVGANLYVRLWRPDVNPNNEFSTDFSLRAFPDQEAIGLTDTNAILGTQRFLDVRAPEAGTWRLRVYHRAGGTTLPCTTPGPEPAGYNYTVTTEIPISARVPTVSITAPPAGSTHTDRVIVFRGTAGYPQRWDGVTNYEVPGTGIALGGDAEDPRVELHFQGNTEEGCTGDGSTDLNTASCNGGNGSSLLPKTALSVSSAASWSVPNPILTVDTERNEFTPNWIWDITSEKTLRGPMTVSWWGSCAACGPSTGSADWVLRLYADGEKAFEQRVTATPSGPNETTLLTSTVDLPTITASDRIVLHIEPVYIDSQNAAKIYYDSADPCPNVPASSPEAACDSRVLLPVVDPGDPVPDQVEDLRVTDVHTGLRLAWDPAAGATSYQIYRSTQPGFAPGSGTLLATTSGTACSSPNVPSWPSASDGGARCFTDTSTSSLTTYYYRVVATGGSLRADPSLLAYGTETAYDRQVRVKGDRLYGAGLAGFARLTSADGTRWRYAFDTLERDEGTASHPNEIAVAARSFTQGIGSANATRTVETVGPAPETPFDPVVLFTKSGPVTASAGDTITYQLRYQNLGPADSSNVKVTDFLPDGVRFVSASRGGAYNATQDTVVWQLGTVPDGSSGTLTVSVRIPGGTGAGSVLVNEARFRASLTFSTPTGAAETTIVP